MGNCRLAADLAISRPVLQNPIYLAFAFDVYDVRPIAMRIVAVIPARLASTRLPRKMLREIGGQTLIGRVYSAVKCSQVLDDVIIATDSEEIAEICQQHGWKTQMTSSKHRSGSERVHEVSQSIPADVYLNVQGDEPLTRPEHIDALSELMRNPEIQVGSLMTVAAPVDVNNPSAVKVVTDLTGRALVFLPSDNSPRSRWYRSGVLQASWFLCLSESRA